VATNYLTLVQTNLVPVFFTNLVQIPVTNLVGKVEAEAGINAAGSILNMFLLGIGSMVALALGGLYHGYRQIRNRKVNEALIQGVETARAVLETTPQGQAADAQLVKWLMEHQKEAGAFSIVSTLVDHLTDNPAAKMTAQEIMGTDSTCRFAAGIPRRIIHGSNSAALHSDHNNRYWSLAKLPWWQVHDHRAGELTESDSGMRSILVLDILLHFIDSYCLLSLKHIRIK